MTAPGRVGPTLSPLALPRSRALTDALLAGGTPPSAAAVATVRRHLEHALGEVAGSGAGAEPPPCLRVRAFDLVRAETGSPVRPDPPFRWTARTARRRIGLAAVRCCVADPSLSPAEAVAAVVSDPAGPTGPGPSGPGSCADWLTSLSAPARSAVEAGATTWATALWTALEWPRLAPAPVVGGADRWWDWCGAGRIALQGRADVRLPGPGGAHLVMLDGYPSPAARRALCFSALVDALRTGGADAPARVTAWWPECGKAWTAAVDGDSLRACADQVVLAVRHVLQARLAGGTGRSAA